MAKVMNTESALHGETSLTLISNLETAFETMKLQPIAEASTSTNEGGRKVRRRRKKGKKGKNPIKPYGQQDQRCHRYGIWRHWSRICHELVHTIHVHNVKQNKRMKSTTHHAKRKGCLNAIMIPTVTPPLVVEDDEREILDIGHEYYLTGV
uniref:Uncharacterized protein n=1 Tax=Oryza meridionalis TaxID=40149 RepID=A0A0E0FC34_9ORYZ